MSIAQLSVGRGYVPTRETPPSVGDLFAATAVRGFGYRAVWPAAEWRIESADKQKFASEFSEVLDLHTRWCAETHVGRDNHQTFVVRTPNGRLFLVMFHDGEVLIGTRLRDAAPSGGFVMAAQLLDRK